MTVFNAIPIDETGLLITVILSAVAFLACLALLIFFAAFSYRLGRPAKNSSDSKRLRNLEERAKTEPWAKKELERRYRKAERIRKQQFPAETIIILVLLVSLNVFCLSALMVPAWHDYFAKDYVCYTGEFAVTFVGRNRWIELEDGTDIRCSDLAEGTYYGTIVYAKGSKVLLGISDTLKTPIP